MADRANAKSDPAAWIGDCIREYAASGENELHLGGGREPAWDEPLVGFSRGSDPLYQRFKEDIGPFCLDAAGDLRGDLSRCSGRTGRVDRDQLDPAADRADQTRQQQGDGLPAERWAHSRKEGEDFNVNLRNHVVAVLREAGYEAVAPMLSPLWKWEKSDRYGFASSWSERHAAYAAGLGTFGLCDGLITPRGKAMRCGSVVARIAVPPSQRPYDDHHAYCLFYFDGSCGKCIKRCPADAISREGHDKEKCRRYLHDVTEQYSRSRFGVDTHPCGLCQTGVPCEAKIPVPGRAG